MEDTYNLALLILRIAFGVTLAIHGLDKLRGISGTASFFHSVGLRPAKFHAWLAAGTEFSAGLGIALGLLTPLASLAYIGVMTTAGWVGHRQNGFSSSKNGWEHVFGLGVVAAVIALLGPGEWSIDNLIHQDITELFWMESQCGLWWSFGIAVVGGVLLSVFTLLTFYRPSVVAQEKSEQEKS